MPFAVLKEMMPPKNSKFAKYENALYGTGIMREACGDHKIELP